MSTIQRPRPVLSGTNGGWRPYATMIIIVLATVIVYYPSLRGGMIWDDNAHITRPELRSAHGLWRIWFELGATQQYYPLLHSAFWIEHRFFGDATLGYHLVNVLLHAAAACLLAVVLQRLKIPGAYLAAAIFALHPVQVESVAWITELKNTLSTVFYLLATLAYLTFDGRRDARFYALALLLFGFGLMSKTVVATLPASLLVIFWWKRGALSWKRDVMPLVPMFIIGAAAGLFTAWIERKLIGAEGAAFSLGPIERLVLAGRAIWFYLAKLLLPLNLIFIYPRWDLEAGVGWQLLFPLCAFALLVGLWMARHWSRGPLASMLFFVGSLFPVLGFFNVYPFIFSYVADHFQYLASMGIIALAAAAMHIGIGRLRSPLGRAIGWALPAALLILLAVLTWRQSRMYSDAQTLYRTTIARNPGCWMAYNNLGNQLRSTGKLQEAVAHYQRALDLWRDYPEAHQNLAMALSQMGRQTEAAAHFRRAIELGIDLPELHYAFGVSLNSLGQAQQAIDQFERALKLKPEYADAHNGLGLALAAAGRATEGISHLRKAIQLNPEFIDAHNNLAWIYATDPQARDPAAAVQFAERAAALGGDRDPSVLDTLAAAYAAAGRTSDALAAAQHGLELARGKGETDLAAQLEKKVLEYKSGTQKPTN